MIAPTYPIDTLSSMAAIPEEALPRFLGELQVILGQIRLLQAAVQMANDAVGEDVLKASSVEGAVWIDDDKRTIDQTIEIAGMDPVHLHGTFQATTA